MNENQMIERQQKYKAINEVLKVIGNWYYGYAGIVDFDNEEVRITYGKPTNVIKHISIRGDNPQACILDVLRGLIPIIEKELL